MGGKGVSLVSRQAGGCMGIDSDTDAVGTGERGTAGREADIEMGTDIDVDRIDNIEPGEDMDQDDAGMAPPRFRHPGRPQQRR